MPRNKIDTGKILKAAKKVGAKAMQKIPGGKVIGKALKDVKKTGKSTNEPKDTYVEHTDHKNTYTKYTKHGKSW